MKLPSIHYLLANAKSSFLRFPLTLICAFISVVIGIYLTECHKNISNYFPYLNLLLCSALGIPLYFCAVIVCDKMRFGKNIRWIVMFFTTAAITCIYFTLPGSESTHNTSLPYVKYAIYNVTIHLFVSFLPFIGSNNLNGYWQYNKILFIRVWVSLLYAGVLYLGLALALGSLKLLFDIKLHEELFFDIYLFVAGIITTWFFVGGIPTDLESLDEITEYPKGLKVFSQYILLPLLALFLLILYVYGGKILVLWHWPKGIVSNLVIGISVLGTLTFLLLHPYGNMSGNGWIRIASRGYYFALIPLLALLFIAIGMRTSEYGLTLSRYVIFLLGAWLIILCLYTALGKTNIKFIPASLAIMLLLMSFGPWGMFQASERSQVNRLKGILEQAGILKNNKINNETIWIRDSLPMLQPLNKEKNDGLLNDSLHNEVYSILHYLDEHHGFGSIRGWYKQDTDSVLLVANLKREKYNKQPEADLYMESLGLLPEYIYRDDYMRKSVNYHRETNTVITVTGYDYMAEFDHYSYNTDSLILTLILDSMPYSLFCDKENNSRFYLKNADTTIDFAFKAMIMDLKNTYGYKDENEIPPYKMQMVANTTKFDFKTEFTYLNITEKSDSMNVLGFTGRIFIKRNRKFEIR